LSLVERKKSKVIVLNILCLVVFAMKTSERMIVDVSKKISLDNEQKQ